MQPSSSRNSYWRVFGKYSMWVFIQPFYPLPMSAVFSNYYIGVVLQRWQGKGCGASGGRGAIVRGDVDRRSVIEYASVVHRQPRPPPNRYAFTDNPFTPRHARCSLVQVYHTFKCATFVNMNLKSSLLLLKHG